MGGALVLAGLVAPAELGAQGCDFPDLAGTLSGVINTYYPATTDAGAGATLITLGAARGASVPISAGDLLLVIQMQDADFDPSNNSSFGDGVFGDPGSGWTSLNSTGLWEYVVASNAVGLGGGALQLIGANAGGLINSYNTQNSSNAGGPSRFQVIRLSRYRNASLSAGTPLTAPAWDGSTGGVVALDLSGQLDLNGGTIDVSGLGFRGGAGRQLTGGFFGGSGTDYVNRADRNYHAEKGEGIAGTPRYVYDGTGIVTSFNPNGYRNSTARGAPGNAGGGGTDSRPLANDQNSGGGGGGNGGTGGMGGRSWNAGQPVGGFGGVAFPAGLGGGSRIVMGGGGGAGTRNNSDGDDSSGGMGGGIVVLRVGAVTGSGTVNASGFGEDHLAPGGNPTTPTPDNDGAGGGGAGGTVIVLSAATNDLGGLTVSALGGDGFDAWPTQPPNGNPGERHGPGGGGGGGVVMLSSAPSTLALTGGTAGTTTTIADHFGATDGGIGVSLTSASLDDTPGIRTCLAVTRATIAGLRVLPSAVEFATSLQRGTAGFNLYAAGGARRRDPRVRLNDSLIEAPVPDSNTPILYRAETGPVTARYLFIEEIEVSGRHRLMGPFDVNDEDLRTDYERIEARVGEVETRERGGATLLENRRRFRAGARRLAAARGFGRLGRRSSGYGVKIETSVAGPVSVPLTDLHPLGLPDWAARSTRWLALTNLGQPVPFSIQDGRLVFQAETLSTDYAGENAYVLSWRHGRGIPPLGVDLTRSGFPRQPGMVRVEQNLFYAPFALPAADPWIWDILTPDYPPGPWSFELPGLVPGTADVPVEIGLVGATDHVHHVSAEINGVSVGAVTIDGRAMGLLKGRIPLSALRETGNELALSYAADGSSPQNQALLFLDVLDLGARLTTPAAPAEPDALAPYDPALPDLRRVQYLILSHHDFLDQARRIAELKVADGLTCAVVDVDRAYDHYSGGVVEPEALHALIRDARRFRSLRYVLLVGDDTFDPRDFSGAGLQSFVPSLNGWDGIFGRVPSENRYADVDGDGKPDVAIGRLPVSTPVEAAAMADKIARQAEVLRSGSGRHLFVVDDQGPDDISFRQEADTVAATLPAGSMISFVDRSLLTTAQARTQLLADLAAGPEMTHYFGHGGLDRWAQEGILRTADVPAVGAAGGETVLFAWTCEVQWFQWDWGPSINEALLLLPQGGALASVGPSGISDPELQLSLARRIYARLEAGESLGEAVRRGKAEAMQAGPAFAPVVDGWTLLGDPALRVDLGTGRAIH